MALGSQEVSQPAIMVFYAKRETSTMIHTIQIVTERHVYPVNIHVRRCLRRVDQERFPLFACIERRFQPHLNICPIDACHIDNA